MMITRILRLTGFVVLAVLASCNKEEEKPIHYFIKFKLDGSPKVFERTTDHGYESCGNCACFSLESGSNIMAMLFVCKGDNQWITKDDIESWNGKTIPFSSSAPFPVAQFHIRENGISYSSEMATDQAGNSLTITSVKPDGKFFDYQMYKVTGTFQCAIDLFDGNAKRIVTEGTFAIRFSEDI